MDAQQLVLALKALGLSQKEIAEKCQLSQGAISHIETGRRTNVFASTKEQLQRLYDDITKADVGETPPSPRSRPPAQRGGEGATADGEPAGVAA
ncbi:MAG: helix-turn-helix transcriptional regulator [Pandoraea sp.]|uniref:helix-turn-helix domain-containing protein n=1 Tax=Pandoraea sp. 64-18 TaxID=1895806 RepID=UPI00095E423E|nr:helix-turn-helix transcriptional regulator [Pandoraea sp.]OJY23561.1 MAG: hypothetical protein BGP02_04635 [Pandoraea sp. 64-18]